MDTVYRFMFLARPLPAHPDYSRIPGAFVDVWVAQPDELTAEFIARDAVKDKRWQIERLENWSVFSRQTSGDLPHSLERALSDGHFLDFYPWPAEREMHLRQAA
jgi:hypothetical protein